MKHYLCFALLGLCLCCVACTEKEPVANRTEDRYPATFPDYVDVTIPPQIAPLRFQLLEPDGGDAIAVLKCGTDQMVTASTREGKFLFSDKAWKKLLQKAVGKDIEVKVYRKDGTGWLAYRPFHWHVSTAPSDGYLAYRLIEPGYELWNRMGIYQRELGSYEQSAIIENSLTGYNCMNCHSFCNRNPEKMLFHFRAGLAGTYFINGKEVDKPAVRMGGKAGTLVYPSWHPSGNFVAFSTNETRQAFHKNDANRVEVYDLASDVVVYDVRSHEVLTDTLLAGKKAFETFPTFSPDGKTLYFCSAEARRMPEEFKQVKYSLCAISFDAETRRFGHRVDTLYNGRTDGRSASFPRVSPDGRWLVFTLSGYGNFSIWHKDADLYLADLRSGSIRPLEGANSDDVESYHSWSGNSRWLVFSSRRMDGLYTRPYMVYINEDGVAAKPFVLPQADPDSYNRLPFSYNIPEFMTGKVKASPRSIAGTARKLEKHMEQ